MIDTATTNNIVNGIKLLQIKRMTDTLILRSPNSYWNVGNGYKIPILYTIQCHIRKWGHSLTITYQYSLWISQTINKQIKQRV